MEFLLLQGSKFRYIKGSNDLIQTILCDVGNRVSHYFQAFHPSLKLYPFKSDKINLPMGA